MKYGSIVLSKVELSRGFGEVRGGPCRRGRHQYWEVRWPGEAGSTLVHQSNILTLRRAMRRLRRGCKRLELARQPIEEYLEKVANDRLGLIGRHGSLIFQIHFDRVAPLEPAIVGSWTNRAILRCTKGDIRALRGALDTIFAATTSFDAVAGFACGAIPIVTYIAMRECRRRFEQEMPRTEEQHQNIRSRFHIFPGLSWTDGSEASFLEWCSGLPKNTRLMVVDASFTGGAVGAIGNILDDFDRMNPAHPRIEVHAIVDRARLRPEKIEGCRARIERGEVVLHPVSSLLTEDFPELLGYSSVQDLVRLDPVWFPGLVVVDNEHDNRFHVEASEPLHATFDRLISDAYEQKHTAYNIEASALPATSFSLLYTVLRNRLSREYSRTAREAAQRGADHLLRLKRELCGRWFSELAELKKTFSISVTPQGPRFCNEIRREKEIIAGDLTAIDLQRYGDDSVLFSLRCVFRDGAGHLQSDFSMILPVTTLEAAMKSGVPLQDLAITFYRKKFDEMWSKLPMSAKTSLAEEWASLCEKVT